MSKQSQLIRDLIAELHETHQISYREIADKLGVQPATVSSYARGKSNPRPDNVDSYINILKDFKSEIKGLHKAADKKKVTSIYNEMIISLAKLTGLDYFALIYAPENKIESAIASLTAEQLAKFPYAQSKLVRDYDGKEREHLFLVDVNDVIVKAIEYQLTLNHVRPINFIQATGIDIKSTEDAMNVFSALGSIRNCPWTVRKLKIVDDFFADSPVAFSSLIPFLDWSKCK